MPPAPLRVGALDVSSPGQGLSLTRVIAAQSSLCSGVSSFQVSCRAEVAEGWFIHGHITLFVPR